MADYGGAISLSQGRDLSANNSDDEDSDRSPAILSSAGRSGRRSSSSNKATKLMIISSSKGGGTGANTSSADQEGSNSSKKPRGRPPGSKNKPKPPIVITRDGDGGMKPVILEVAAGADVVDTVVEYARRNRVGISLLSGAGSVSNVTLRHPMTHAPTLSLHGTYHLLCLSGSYLASASTKPNSSASSAATFGLTVAGQQGQVFGGIVAGSVTAATTVVVVAATYVNPAYHRLPVMDGGEGGGDGSGDGSHEEQRCGGGGGGAGVTTTSGTVGISVPPYGISAPAPLNCQMSPDVMSWGPTSRSPY